MITSKTAIDIKKTGKRLQYFAKWYGYTVKDIQEYLGLSCPQSIYRWYKGVILPSIDNLLRLSELYHVHMEELLIKSTYSSTYDINAMKQNNFEKRIMAYYKRLQLNNFGLSVQ